MKDHLLLAGVLFNVLIPDWLQTALLTVLLLFVINKTVRKGIKQWRQEQRAIEQKRKADELAQVRVCSSLADPVLRFCEV